MYSPKPDNDRFRRDWTAMWGYRNDPTVTCQQESPTAL
ncbi:UNVERIFIED_ORG: hypothetical protein M2382_001934 [Enterobacter sp. BIGb0239]